MKTKISSILLLGVLAVAGCKKVDLYKETNKELAALFPDGETVPSGFNWSSIKTVDVRIAIDDQYNGQYFYKVEVFDGDPALGNTVNLLAAGQAKQNKDFVSKIAVPTALEYVYVKKTSPVGVASVSMLSVADASPVAAATGSKVAAVASVNKAQTNSLGFTSRQFATTQQANTTGISSTPAVTVPANAIPLDDNSSYNNDWGGVNNSSKIFVIKAGTTYTKSFMLNNGISGIKVYVQGKWETSAGVQVAASNEILVVESGVLNIPNFAMPNGGSFYNAGISTVGSLNVNSASGSSNYGTLTVNGTLSVPDAGRFYNYGVATVNKLTANSATGFIRNEGSLVVTEGDITNATMEVACHTTFGTLKINGGGTEETRAKVRIAEGALLSINKLSSGSARYTLSSGAILDVSELAEFTSNQNVIEGVGAVAGLAKLKKFSSGETNASTLSGQKGGIVFLNNVEVACSDHTINGQWNTYYTVLSPARLVAYDQSTVVIAGTACNAGGHNWTPTTPPEDQTVTEVNLGTYSYAFEDNWPSFGDYDMNDFVTDITITKFQNSANKVTKLRLNARLRSVGAIKRLAAAVQLDGVPVENVKSVTYSREDLVGQTIPLASNKVESGQKYAVLAIADDAHKAFGASGTPFISTQNGSHSPVDVVITVEFNTPLDHLTYQDINTFVITDGYKHTSRNEIHMVGYKATDKINSGLVTYQTEKIGQLLAGDPFQSHDGYPWAICVPVSFVYPSESQKISDAYPRFRSWAQSGGVSDANWYIKK